MMLNTSRNLGETRRELVVVLVLGYKGKRAEDYSLMNGTRSNEALIEP